MNIPQWFRESQPMNGQRYFCPNEKCTYIGPHERIMAIAGRDGRVFATWRCPQCKAVTSTTTVVDNRPLQL